MEGGLYFNHKAHKGKHKEHKVFGEHKGVGFTLTTKGTRGKH